MNITPLELYELIKLVAESKPQGEYIDRFPPFINRQYKDEEEPEGSAPQDNKGAITIDVDLSDIVEDEEEKAMAKICDDYCRFLQGCYSDDDLDEICDNCMICDLIKRRQK